jgi:ATP-dependent DNA helicase RecG
LKKFLTKTEIQSSDIVEGNLFEQITNALEILRSKYLISKIKQEGVLFISYPEANPKNPN